MMKRTYTTLLCLLLFVIASMPLQGYAMKYALVIGNSNYENAPLKNPRHDASDMAVILRKLGFSVTQKIDVTHQNMENAIRAFAKQLHSGDTALFYFSGHGLQVEGINYLLPIGLDVQSADEIKYKAVNANMILDKLEDAGSQVNIIILDSCRNNPFKRFRSLDQGLAMMSAPSGTLIAYATAPGSVAYDGDNRDKNSPYTKHLLEMMQTPGLGIERVFKSVRVAVMRETEQKQVPWESSSLTGDFYFTPSSTLPIACEDSNRIVNPDNNHCYQRIDTPMSWHTAKTHCQKLGGHLATLTSQEERNFIYRKFKDSRYILWLGGTDEEKEGKWKWITREPWGYTDWAEAEPSNCDKLPNGTCRPEHYLHIIFINDDYWRNGRWNDALGAIREYDWGDYGRYKILPLCEWE